MNRRSFLVGSALAAAAGPPVAALAIRRSSGGDAATLQANPLPVPAGGAIRTAIAIGDGFNVIDVDRGDLPDSAIGGGSGRSGAVHGLELNKPVAAAFTVKLTYVFDYAPPNRTSSSSRHNASPETVEWLRAIVSATPIS